MHRRRPRQPSLERLEDRLCLTVPPTYPGAPFQLPQSGSWINSPFMASPIFSDLDGNGRDELITTVAGGALMAYQTSASGQILPFRTYSTGAPVNIQSTPIVVDLPGGRKGIFAATGRDQGPPGSPSHGLVYGWDALTGAILPGWPQHTMPNANNNYQSGVTGPLAAGDLDGDLVPEIVVTSFSHFVTAFKIDGSVLWRFMNDETVEAGVVVGDIDRDGRNEVVFASGMSPNGFFPAGGLINVLNSNGTSRFRIHVGELFFAAPILADLTGDGYLEIIAAPSPHFADPSLSEIGVVPGALAAGNRIYAFNHRGELLPGWPYRTTTNDSTFHQVWKELAAADLDGNGTIEIIAIDAGGFQPPNIAAPDPRVHVVQANGTALPGWSGGRSAMPPPQFTQPTPWASPIVVDVNGDGALDIVVAYGVFLLAFDRSGNQLFWDVVGEPGVLPDPRANAAAVGQFDGQGGLELATVSNAANSAGRPNMVSIYRLPQSTAAPAWPMHRRNASGDAIQRSLPYLRQFVNAVAQATLGRAFDTGQVEGFARALADNRYSPFLFARVLASGPEARGRVVDDLYLRFLGRAPEPAARAEWINRLGSQREVDLIRQIATSAEFRARGDALGGLAGRVELLLRGLFPLEPTRAEIDGWTRVVQQGWATYEQLVESLATSNLALLRRILPAFQALGKPVAADSITAAGDSVRRLRLKEADVAADVLASGGNLAATHELSRWVRTLYRDLLGREAAGLEVAWNVSVIESGRFRVEDIARGVVNSLEARQHFVREQFRRLLRREPSAGEVAGMVNFARREDVIVTIAGSPEYFQGNGNTLDGFIRATYRDLAYFNPATITQATVDAWIRPLSSGTPRSALISAHLNSELIPEQLFKYLPDESQGVLRSGSSPGTAPGQPLNPNPGAVAWLRGILESTGRVEDVIVALVTTPEYLQNSAYWKGQYRSRGWRS